MLQWIVTAGLWLVGGVDGEGSPGAGDCRSRQIRRARWRLRQRSASRRLCLRPVCGPGRRLCAASAAGHAQPRLTCAAWRRWPPRTLRRMGVAPHLAMGSPAGRPRSDQRSGLHARHAYCGAPAGVNTAALSVLLPAVLSESRWGMPDAPDALLRVLEGHGGRVWAVAFAPDGRTLASAGDDGRLACGIHDRQPDHGPGGSPWPGLGGYLRARWRHARKRRKRRDGAVIGPRGWQPDHRPARPYWAGSRGRLRARRSHARKRRPRPDGAAVGPHDRHADHRFGRPHRRGATEEVATEPVVPMPRTPGVSQGPASAAGEAVTATERRYYERRHLGARHRYPGSRRLLPRQRPDNGQPHAGARAR